MSHRYEHGTATLGNSVLVGMIEGYGTGAYSISIDSEDTDMLLTLGSEWTVTFDLEPTSVDSVPLSAPDS